MGHDIDWQESEWLVNQLRARLSEEDGKGRIKDLPKEAEESATAPETAAIPPQTVEEEREETVAGEAPAPVEEETLAPVVKEDPTPVAEESFDCVVEGSPVPVVEEDPVPVIEESPVPVPEPETLAPTFAHVPPPQKRTALFATSYTEESEGEFSSRVASEPKRKGRTRRAAPHPRTKEELRAEVTVENLMQDLFGEGAKEEWFEASSEQDQQPAPVEVKEKAPVQTELETITRDKDGQMALVLPETGKPLALPSGGAEHHATRTSAAERPLVIDDGQIDLFTAEAGEEPILAPDPERERMDLRRSIEASEEEFRFLMEMDYETELGEVIGFEKIRAYHEEGVNGAAVVKRRRRRTGEKREYEAQGQDTSLRKRYTKQKSEHILRFALSLALTLLIFIYERTTWMSALFGGPFDGEKYPVSYVLIGIQLLLIASYFSYQRLFEGFARLLRFSPIDYSLCSMAVVATLVYHVILIFLPSESAPALYLSPAALCLSMLALADLLDWYRESLAFQVVSSRKQKYALIPRASVGGRQGDARASIDEDETGGVFYVRPVGFVRNYFANTERRVEHNRALGAQFLLILAIGLSLGLYVLALGGTVTQMLQTAFVAFLLCLPITSLLVTSVPMFFAAALRLGKKGAIVGEGALYQSMQGNTVVIPDDEVFASMQHERFEFFEDDDPTRYQILLRALLERVHSPLRDAVRVARDLRLNASQLSLIEIAEHGVCAALQGKEIKLLLGDAAYMEEHGVAVQLPPTVESEGGGSLLIFAVNGRAIAFFLARYRIKDDMLSLLDELQEQGVRLLVRSKDPAVCDALFATLLPERRDPVRVMKPTVREMDLRTDRVDATMVALGSCRDAVRTYLTCRRVRRMGAFGKVFQFLSVSVGVLLSILFTVVKGAVGMSSFLVSVYLLFWCAIHAAASYFYLREEKE